MVVGLSSSHPLRLSTSHPLLPLTGVIPSTSLSMVGVRPGSSVLHFNSLCLCLSLSLTLSLSLFHTHTHTLCLSLSLSGVVLYHPSHGYLQNNSILTASSDGHINRLQCISDTTTPLVQEWVTPSRHPTLNITHGNGVAPGVIELGVLDGGVFTADLQGVYTCVVDDVSGRVHQLSVGLFPHAFSGELSLSLSLSLSLPLSLSLSLSP